MKRYFFSILVLLLVSVSLYGQIVDTILTVKPDGTIYQTKPTEDGHTYRITVEGTYSMWPEFTDCHGVDAVYIYDVPETLRKSGKWPEFSTFSNPHWVGDDSLWKAPKYEVNLRNYTGFRIDDEPLKKSEILLSTNRYVLEKAGTGKPFTFTILDFILNPLTQKMVTDYIGNCGKLIVTIQEIITGDPVLCDIKTICDANGQIIGLQVAAAIFQDDSTNIHGKKNLLRDIDIRQLGLIYNGKFICPEERICLGDTTKPITIGILLDRSGSMGDAINANDPTTKMTASKKSINRFIDHFKPADSAFVMSFATDYRLDQNWSHDKILLKATINKLIPGGTTNLFDAILSSLDKISKSSTENRALVVLSDGMSNEGSPWSSSIIDRISQKNIPIYIVALGYQAGDLAARKYLDTIASRTLGKVFDVNTASKLDSVYEKLAIEVREGNCCTIKFPFEDGCDSTGENYIRLIYSPGDTAFVSQVVKFNCTCDTTIKKPTKPILVSPEDKAVDIPINTSFMWKKSQYATFYNLEISTKSDLSNPVFNQYNDTKAIWSTNLIPGTTYYWRVQATNSQDNSDYSDIWSFTTIEEKLDAPVLISPENGAMSVPIDCKFLWNKVKGATKYRIFISRDPNLTNYVYDEIINDTTFIGKNPLYIYEKYYWQVKALNDTKESNWSYKWSFSTKEKLQLATPINGATGVNDVTKFTWSSGTQSNHYQLQIATDNNFSVIYCDKDLLYFDYTNLANCNLDDMTTYYWRVRGIKSTTKDTTYWSDIWNFKTDIPFVGIIDPKFQNINIYPNPTENKAVLHMYYTETCDARIEISNAEGKIIKTDTIRIMFGNNIYEIITKNWNSGSYYVTITTPLGHITRELIVAR